MGPMLTRILFLWPVPDGQIIDAGQTAEFAQYGVALLSALA
jgi:hypothetical protein